MTRESFLRQIVLIVPEKMPRAMSRCGRPISWSRSPSSKAYRAADASRDADFYELYSDRALVHVRVGP
jgi:hypothetical protein